jgi:hypothetical protein
MVDIADNCCPTDPTNTRLFHYSMGNIVVRFGNAITITITSTSTICSGHM